MKVAICTGSFACKSVALGNQETILIHTTVTSYTWQALWKKSRELAVLIITQNMACPVLFYGSCRTMSRYQGGCREGEDQKVWRVRNRKEGVQFVLSLNSANRKKRQIVHTVISLHELRRSGHGPSPQAFL